MVSTSSASLMIPLASQWLQECITTHHSCSKHARHSEIMCTDNCHFIIDIDFQGLLPSRMLEIKRMAVGGAEMEDHHVYVIDCSSLPPGTPYTTLSYRWGEVSKSMMATMSNLHALMNDGIALQKLPRTFRDAVQVTLGLGYSHIWIDSLCILQDDPQDWKQEARRMAMIYGKTVCTIVAMDGSDADSGLVCTSADRESVGGLESRGWVCQERMISPRSLIFTNGTILWECRESDASEKNNTLQQRYPVSNKDGIPEHPKDIFTFFRDWRLPAIAFSSNTLPDENKAKEDQKSNAENDNESEYGSDIAYDDSGNVVLNYDSKKLPAHTANLKNYIRERGLGHFETPLNIYPGNDQDDPFGRWMKLVTSLTHPHDVYYPFIKVWWQFLQNYTPRNLTFGSDRFLAMNGITNIAQRWTHLRSTFGLWFHFLEYELCWYVETDIIANARRPATWLGPSWSWVSTQDGRICNDLYHLLPSHAGAMQIKPEICTPVATTFDMPLPLDAWTRIQYYSIELHGNLREATVTTTQDSNGNTTCILVPRCDGRFSDSAVYEFRPDCKADFPTNSTLDVFCLHMRHYNADYLDLPEFLDVYIVLKQVAAGRGNLPLQLTLKGSPHEDKLAERRMKRLGYLKSTYKRGTKRSVSEIEGWWWWIQLV